MGGSESKSVPICFDSRCQQSQLREALDIWFWYEGKSGERPGEYWYRNSVESCDVKELKKTAEQHHITHLILEGRMRGDLYQMVPNLTHLKIADLPKQDHHMLESIGKLSNLQELGLHSNKLNHLPESIGKLSYLYKLDLSRNELTHLPESIGKLSNLQMLWMSYNKLSCLPESIKELSNLQELDLDANDQLTHLPEIIGELSNLQELYLSDNQLTHLPESIGKLNSLRNLRLGINKLTHLPESIAELSNLQKLYLDKNQLTHLPESIGKIGNLEQLSLGYNKLTHLPESIGKLSYLQGLYLMCNQLTHLPESIGELGNLHKLILLDNKLNHLPESIGELSNLQELYLSENQLNHLPKNIGELSKLQELYMRDNQLTHLPESIGELINLQKLHLSRNKLTHLPESIGKLSNLQMLWMSNNKLTHLPESIISRLSKLTLLGVYGCDSLHTPPLKVCEQGIDAVKQYFKVLGKERGLAGFDSSGRPLLVARMGTSGSKEGASESKGGNSVPKLDVWFWYEGKSCRSPVHDWYNNMVKSCGVNKLKEEAEQHHITHLILQDSIPADLDQLVPSLTHLKIADLPKQDHHKLESIEKLSNLQELYLRDNNLTHLPESIGKLSYLQKLDLRHNKLTHLPESIGKLSNLQELYLGSTKLTHLPESIGKLSNLRKLDLESNKLTHLPESVGELSYLQELYLRDNQLTHHPKSIGELSSLQNLYLSSNKLTNLPESIGELINLQKLYLFSNQLTHLPESIGKLSNLKELLLYRNQLTHLPESIGELSNLHMLWMSGNQLTHLPDSIGKLSNLRKLWMSNNKLTHLPESIGELSNLQELYLRNNQLTHIPMSIISPSKLTELDVYGCDSLQTPPLKVCEQGIDAVRQYFKDRGRDLDVWFWYEGKSGRRLGYDDWSRNVVESCNVNALLKAAGQHHITHLILQGCIPETLDQLVPSLTHLKIKHLPKQDHHNLERLGELSNLQELILDNNQLTHLPESIGELSNLHTLNLSNNKLTQLPESIGKLSNLPNLVLRDNQLTHLPESIGKLSRLNFLTLGNNQLTHLPESIGELSNLHMLWMSGNQLTHIPESIGELSNLHMLWMSGNQLTHLPESIGEFCNLQELDLYSNKLSDFPESIGKLSNLRKLWMSNNKLTHLPESIGELSNLQELYLRDNQLTHIPVSIIKLSKLTKLDVEGCTSLHTPPLQVCKQGIGAIKQYFKDLAKGQGKSLPAATIAVMGEKMAGKTSLIRTLQSKEKKRVLTVRRPETGRDDATRVFNVEEVATDDMILRFVDVGGHEVYHSTYPLTLRDSCVPAVVINLKKYSILSKDKETGKTEAVRSLCFDTLSQLYISNPKLGPPLLVLTHIDLLDDDQSFECVREDFVKQCELLRQRLLREDQQLVGRLDGHFGNSNIPLFNKSDIFCIGGKSDSFQVFESIIDALRLGCKKFLKIVPAIWEMISDTLSSSSRPYVKFAELLQSLSESHGIHKAQLEFILIYLHECGKILWYPNVVELKPYIFQSIPELTKLLCVLFAHDDDTKWETRLADEKTFVRSDGRIVEHEEYQAMYLSFSTSGIMDADLLLHLIKSESSFTADTDTAPALAILCQFRLIYGPSKFVGCPSYLSPYFAVGYQSKDFLTTDSPVRMHSQMNFKGLTIPRYVYGRISVDVIHLLSDDLSDDISLTQNGLTIHLGHLSIRFTHDFKSRKATLEIATGIEYLTEGRNLMQKLISAIKFHTETAWPVTRIVTEITCTHCLLRADPHPKKMVNPIWLSDQHPKTDPMKSMICQGEKKIPACLIVPCASLTKKNMKSLKSYTDKNWIKGASPEPSEPGAGDISLYHRYNTADKIQSSGLDKTWAANTTPVRHAHSDNEYDSDISEDGGGLLTPEDELDYVIRRKPQDTWKEHIKSLFFNTDKVYEMSKGTRGCALIINIERFNGPNALNLTRTGSSVDVENMSSMLKEFKIELSEVKENLDAQEILGAIKEETQHKHHKDYNMFVLCVMTHGKEDEQILGSDQQVVKLKDIYELLSPMKFPAMAGKPKVIVIQACAGDKKDLGKGGLDSPDQDPAEASHINDPDQPTRPKVLSPTSGSSQGANAGQLGEKNMNDSPPEAGNINQLDVDDLLIIRSSFESYSSMRSEKTGSLFIRCLVATLNKHACHRDLYSLCEIVQHRVRTESQKLAKKYPGRCYGQTIVAIKTFTRMRKVYLFPGYNPRADRAVTSSHAD